MTFTKDCLGHSYLLLLLFLVRLGSHEASCCSPRDPPAIAWSRSSDAAEATLGCRLEGLRRFRVQGFGSDGLSLEGVRYQDRSTIGPWKTDVMSNLLRLPHETGLFLQKLTTCFFCLYCLELLHSGVLAKLVAVFGLVRFLPGK